MRLFRNRQNKKSSLHNRILLGLVAGAALGTVANYVVGTNPHWEHAFLWALGNLIEPVGQVFLRLLFMIVVPLILSSLTLGVAAIGDVRRLGRIGALTFGYFIMITTLATTLGLVLVNVLQPGGNMPEETRARLMESYQSQAQEKLELTGGVSVSNFVNIIPRNPVDAAARGDMLGIICFSLILGAGLTQLPTEKSKPVLDFLEGISLTVAVIIRFTMRLAPYGVFALIFGVTARFGWDILVQLLNYVFVVLLGLALFQFVGYGILVKLLCGIRPMEFFRKIRDVAITGFSTSSSNATLPTTIETAETELGIPSEIAGFVLPLGATMNMNGTALFEGVTVLFLAQVFGVHLSLGQQLIVVLMAVLSAVGTAGVPGGSIPLLAGVLGVVGIPPEGIALIIGVDRILDMSRTVLNVSGDLTAAAFVTERERLRAARNG